MVDSKKNLFSGIQPSGELTIANYIGAIKQWKALQDKYNCLFSVADYHAISVKYDAEKLRERIINTARIFMAMGLDSSKSIIFQQSALSEHTELAWILGSTVAHVSDLNKMTQYKDKSKDRDAVALGLFSYPVLMAADILLYNTHVVPVGEDQFQHLELARDIAKRFNNRFGNSFVIPQEISLEGDMARIRSLTRPEKKMAKSEEDVNSFISLFDAPQLARKKILRAKTDSNTEIDYDMENRPGISNLLNIYATIAGREVKRLVKDYRDKNYSEFKNDLAEVIVKFLSDFQFEYNKINNDEVKRVLAEGAMQAKEIASKKLQSIKYLIGINY